MARLKSNKYALMLFIASIVFAVAFIAATIITFATMDSVIAAQKEELINQGYETNTIDTGIAFAKSIIVVAFIFGGILLAFMVVCGIKASLQNQWVKGAFVFGIIYVIFEGIDVISTVSKKPLNTSNLIFGFIYLAISIFYLVGAAHLKNEPVQFSDATTIEVEEATETKTE